MTSWLADTSVAVPLVHVAHVAHERVNDAVGERPVGLPAHAAIETYSVLTRLPGDARLPPIDASALIDERFDRIEALQLATQRTIVQQLLRANLAGGAVYDALIAITAREAGSTLLTRDARAAATYSALDIRFELVA